MLSFKPLLNNGRIEGYVEEPKAAPPQPRELALPDFGFGEAVPAPASGEKQEVVAYDIPDMGDHGEPALEHKIRKYVDIKEKVFLPLITLDEDEDPLEVSRREAEKIVSEAGEQARQLQNQAGELWRKTQNEAAALLEEANNKHEQMQAALAAAEQEAVAIKQRAQEEGFDLGYKDGQEQGLVAGKARLEALMADLSLAVKNVEQARNDVAAALNAEIVALVAACADKLFLTASSVDAGLVAQVVMKAIERLDDTSQVKVRLNPSSLEHMAALAPELWHKFEAMKGVSWLADNSLRPGDCIIDTPITQIDATMESRRKRIYDLLEDMLQQGKSFDLSALLNEAAHRRAAAFKPTQDEPSWDMAERDKEVTDPAWLADNLDVEFAGKLEAEPADGKLVLSEEDEW